MIALATVMHDPQRRLFSAMKELFPCEVEGMEYEAADCYPEEVKAAGGVREWVRRVSADPGQWVLRLEYAHAVGRAALETARGSGYPGGSS